MSEEFPVGATLLNADDKNGLIPKGINTRGQLDEFESRNIQQALMYFRRRKFKPKDILNVDFCLALHRKMFDKTWEWAGRLRRYEVNIGNTSPSMVSWNVRNVCDDGLYWVLHGIYEHTELCARFHHRLVYIHPFPNGNGRHSRIMVDFLARSVGKPNFSWGSNQNLTAKTDTRLHYIDALRKADNGDFMALTAFIES